LQNIINTPLAISLRKMELRLAERDGYFMRK